jgi:hypothetical protein
MLNVMSFRTKVILWIVMIFTVLGIMYLFGPLFSVATFHYDKDHFVISPIVENYHYLLTAFGIFIAGLVILAWKKTKWTIFMACVSFVAFCYFNYAATQGYFALHEDYVIYKTAKAEQKYRWDELSGIEFIYQEGGVPKTLYFYKGEEVIEMHTTGQFTYDTVSNIRRLTAKYHVPYTQIAQQK